MRRDDLEQLGRGIVDTNAYATLATADATGTPWAAPVWFAHIAYETYLWVSRPESRHSRNLAVRPEIGMVIFDSTVPAGTGRGVYLEATARQVGDEERDPSLEVFSTRSVGGGGPPWSIEAVTRPGGLRLYAATASAQFVLDDHDRRQPVRL